MKFEIIESSEFDEIVYYHTNEHSFFYDDKNDSDIFFLIAYIELGFDSDDMIMKSISGLSFSEGWKDRVLKAPAGKSGKVRLVGNYESGKTYKIDKDEVWNSYFDKSTEWFCSGNPNINSDDTSVRVLKNVYMVFDEVYELKSIWIKPIFR